MDLWSLGLLLFFVASGGRHLFVDGKDAQTHASNDLVVKQKITQQFSSKETHEVAIRDAILMLVQADSRQRDLQKVMRRLGVRSEETWRKKIVDSDNRFKICREDVLRECGPRKDWWACEELLGRLAHHGNTGVSYRMGEVVGGELSRTEYKAGQFVPSLLAYIVGFANGIGGRVVFGVREPNAEEGEQGHAVSGYDFKNGKTRKDFDAELGKLAKELTDNDFTANHLFHAVQMPVLRSESSTGGQWVAEVHVNQSPKVIVLTDSDTKHRYMWVRFDAHNSKFGVGMSKQEKAKYEKKNSEYMKETMKKKKLDKAGFWRYYQRLTSRPALSKQERSAIKTDEAKLKEMQRVMEEQKLTEEEYWEYVRGEIGFQRQEDLLVQKITEIEEQRKELEKQRNESNLRRAQEITENLKPFNLPSP